MTGEITLRGRVLPIGGLKEKLLAALQGGIKTVLIPKDNEKDLAEIPDNVKRGMEIIPVTVVDEVLDDVPRELVYTRIDRQPFVDDFAPEDIFESLVHGVSYRSSLGTKPMIESRLLSSRRRIRVVSKVISISL